MHATSLDHELLAHELPGSVIDALGGVRFLKKSDPVGWRTVDRIRKSDLAACKSSEDILALLKDRVSHLSIGTDREASWIVSIPPVGPNGFAIDMTVEAGWISGLFGELEHEFSTVPELLTWVQRALSRDYQLRSVLRGDYPIAWYLEPTDPSVLESRARLGSGTVTLRNFWKSKRTVIRSNALPSDAVECCSKGPETATNGGLVLAV